MTKMEELINAAKISELLSRREDRDCKSRFMHVMAIIGILAAIAGVCYLVYKYFFAPDYMDDFEDEFEDDFEDDFFDDDEDEYDE